MDGGAGADLAEYGVEKRDVFDLELGPAEVNAVGHVEWVLDKEEETA